MSFLKSESLALLTDLYQLTMAAGYWKEGMADREAVFHLFFRRHPFQGNYAIAAGLQTAVEFIESFRFEESDITYLATLQGSNGAPLFETGFLEYLKTFRLTCDLDAMPEGTPVCPYEPILRVKAPLIQAQLLESPLLNIVNFQSLIATKAARICLAAHPDPVVEFGMRRAHGIDGAISASRAAFIGGCDGTSHVLAGKLFGIPVKGTLAHSWVMAFDDEEEAFRAFGRAMPGSCVFLVDTYDSIAGTKKAIAVAKELKKQGVEVQGVRLDSGDLTVLSVEIRELLDAAGLSEVKIMASNELDEYLISDLKRQGTKVTQWGVGTHLVTAKEQPALDGVYKLAALRGRDGKWQYKLKISEKMSKMTDPGVLQVCRFEKGAGHVCDVIYDIEKSSLSLDEMLLVDDPGQKIKVPADASRRDLLVPILKEGKLQAPFPSLHEVRGYSLGEQSKFPNAMRRFLNPQPYPVGYDGALYERKRQMIKDLSLGGQ